MPTTVTPRDPSLTARRAAHATAATSLALLSDQRIAELLDSAAPLGSGIGGTSALLDVDGTPVFVKRVPLTDRELRPEHLRSTANLHDLPVFCQYGMGSPGSPGVGAWRELAAHTMATHWALAGEYEGFPLMYHWRVVPDPAPSLPEELQDVDAAVAYWGGGAGVRERIEGVRDSTASLALFLEYLPYDLHTWLTERTGAGTAGADGAYALVERELAAAAAFMRERGLIHFDAHFGNLLTDGHRLYVADFGLALSSRFDLSPAERSFFAHHATYDRSYTAGYLVNWLVTTVYGHQRAEREALIRACAAGAPLPEGTPPGAASIITRHAPLTAVVTDFHMRLMEQSRETAYPAEEIGRLLAGL
ncbi:protein kinase family protein [Streptomyces sp. NPDC057638]|uniref:protein kinase family protein n=1 Tax=Streptomyces sp. NPDC057638 TaxID=3346190 RepID=UPI003681C494